MPLWIVFLLPWLALALFVAFGVRLPRALPPPDDSLDGGPGPPRVSVVVPARNEAHNVGRVLGSLAGSEYPRFEIIVVDDRSEDGTGELARSQAPGNAERIEVVEGRPLPDGWLGKPWACAQGAERARGELLLFTDADTVHGPELLARSVTALEAEGADALTVIGRQLMESFWERLVQPHVFLSMVLRYPRLMRPIPRSRWRSAIANGQYILFRRESYDALGGHEAVSDAVVEDLRLAQILVRDGWRFRIFRAEDAFATRMYRSLREIVAGWSKNLVLGGLQTLPPVVRPFVPPIMLAAGAVLWLAPPLVLLATLTMSPGPESLSAGAFPWPDLAAWAGGATALSAAFWCGVSRRFGVPWVYGLLYPLGVLTAAFIVARSWIGMGRVRWKGRSYRVMLHD